MRTLLLASSFLLATACAASAIGRCALPHHHNMRGCGDVAAHGWHHGGRYLAWLKPNSWTPDPQNPNPTIPHSGINPTYPNPWTPNPTYPNPWTNNPLVPVSWGPPPLQWQPPGSGPNIPPGQGVRAPAERGIKHAALHQMLNMDARDTSRDGGGGGGAGGGGGGGGSGGGGGGAGGAR